MYHNLFCNVCLDEPVNTVYFVYISIYDELLLTQCVGQSFAFDKLIIKLKNFINTCIC